MSWADELNAEIVACIEADARAKMKAVHLLLEEQEQNQVNCSTVQSLRWQPTGYATML